MKNLNIDKNSMLFWYPKIKDILIPQPKTIMIEVDPKHTFDFIEEGEIYPQHPLFERAAESLGYPLFMRTDQMSGKHDWKNTCFVENKKALMKNLGGIINATLCCDIMGRPINAIVFREYIPMDSKYTAFYGDMPVSPERRYFIENQKVLCHHPYWFEEAILKPSVHNWRELSREMNEESCAEIVLLTQCAEMVARGFKDDGFWSVDFCRARDGRWFLIDMAVGENSWHPQDCPNNRTKKIDLLRQTVDESDYIEKLAKEE